jgi:hypothetical protein
MEEIFRHQNEKFKNLFFETLFLKSEDQILLLFQRFSDWKKISQASLINLFTFVIY